MFTKLHLLLSENHKSVFHKRKIKMTLVLEEVQICVCAHASACVWCECMHILCVRLCVRVHVCALVRECMHVL